MDAWWTREQELTWRGLMYAWAGGDELARLAAQDWYLETCPTATQASWDALADLLGETLAILASDHAWLAEVHGDDGEPRDDDLGYPLEEIPS